MNNNDEVVFDTFLSEILQKEYFIITGNIKTIQSFKENAIYTYTFDFDQKIMDLCTEKGFTYLGGRVDFILRDKNKTQEVDVSEYSIVTDNTVLDFENIDKIAHTIAKTSRFYKDPYTEKYAFSLYETWIRNSLLHGYADDFLLLKKKDTSIALITVKKEKKGMRIDLIGVSDAYQKKGIGTILVNLVKKKYKEENIYVGAQSEHIGALNFYYKNGFIADAYKMIYRKYT